MLDMARKLEAFFSILCGVPTQIVSLQQSMWDIPTPSVWLFLTLIVPHTKKVCGKSPLPVYVFSYGMSNPHPCPPHPPM